MKTFAPTLDHPRRRMSRFVAVAIDLIFVSSLVQVAAGSTALMISGNSTPELAQMSATPASQALSGCEKNHGRSSLVLLWQPGKPQFGPRAWCLLPRSGPMPSVIYLFYSSIIQTLETTSDL